MRVYKKKQFDEELCAKLYLSGVSKNVLRVQFGIREMRIKEMLLSRGIQIRPRQYYSVGDRNPAWIGGRTVDKDGYILVYAPNHPFCGRHKKVREHRLLMEKKIGRFLLPTEVVDHKNGIKYDNRISNLQLYASNADHLRATLKGKVPKWTEAGRQRILEGLQRPRKTRRSKIDASESL